MSGELYAPKNLLAGMPPHARLRLAQEIAELPIPDAKAIHADVMRAIHELNREAGIQNDRRKASA